MSPVSPWIVSETAASVPAFHRSPVTTVTSYDTAETCTDNQQCVSVYFNDAACCSTRPPGRCKVSLRRRRAVLYRRVELTHIRMTKKGKASPYSITERRVPELIPVLGSQPAGDVNHKPGGRLPLLSARHAVSYPHNP